MKRRNWFALLVFCIGLLLAINSARGAPIEANLSWTAPTERADGTPLQAGDLAEYRIYYRIDDLVESGPLVVTSGQAETVTIDLAPRPAPYTITFEVTAVDSAGLESDRSNPVEKAFTVRSTAPPGPPTQLLFDIRCGDGCTITPH